jgi:Ca-activated chloride channel family protein
LADNLKLAAIKSHCVVFFVAIAVATFLNPCVTLGRGAQGSTAVQAQHPLEAKTELVKLDVSVLDKEGKFVGGLEQKNFRVLDNGAERPILFFAPVETPARIVVMIETSPAVYMIKDEHIAASYALLNGLAEDDQVALVTYSDLPKELLPFTSDRAALQNAIGGNQYMIGMAALNLYDSIASIVEGIAPVPGKKAIVLLSTGLDSSGPEHFDALVQKLRTQDVVIFAVGLGGSLNDDSAPVSKAEKKAAKAKRDAAAASGPTMLEKARAALLSLATMTGGRAYFPASGQEFAPAYQEIASAVRHEYVLGIAPQHDGQLHKLSVSVPDAAAASHKSKGRAEFSVSARDGYIAPGP